MKTEKRQKQNEVRRKMLWNALCESVERMHIEQCLKCFNYNLYTRHNARISMADERARWRQRYQYGSRRERVKAKKRRTNELKPICPYECNLKRNAGMEPAGIILCIGNRHRAVAYLRNGHGLSRQQTTPLHLHTATPYHMLAVERPPTTHTHYPCNK